MANRGYCSNAQVAAFLGLTLTAGQQIEADTLIGAAESFIDRDTRRGWMLPPITGERYNLTTPTLYLRSHPIASVQSIVTRTQAIGDTPYTAIAGVDYDVFDLNLGQINFSSGYSGPHAVALVSYTPNLPVPADIALCATLIVAETLARALFPGRLGVKQADPERGVRIVYTAYGDTMSVPPLAQEILNGYRTPIV